MTEGNKATPGKGCDDRAFRGSHEQRFATGERLLANGRKIRLGDWAAGLCKAKDSESRPVSSARRTAASRHSKRGREQDRSRASGTGRAEFDPAPGKPALATPAPSR